MLVIVISCTTDGRMEEEEWYASAARMSAINIYIINL